MDNDINREINIEQVEFGIDIDNIEYSIEINPRDTFAIELNEQGPQGARGYTGNGIESYVKTSSSGLTDTYTITFTDGNTTTVNVTNGRSITSITGPVSVGNVDTYTINYNDSTTSTFTVTNGIDGVNPTITVGSTATGNPGTNASVVNTGTTQDVILDFTIPRGDKGDTGTAATIAVGTVTTGLPTDPASVTNVGTSGAAVFDFTIPKGDTGDTGATGNGIASITKTGTVGLVDTYTILYTDGTSTTFTVTNGQNGTGSVADVLVNGTSVLDGKDAKILIKTINNNSIVGSGNLTLDGLPTQTGQSGKFLTTDGTDASWATVSIPTVNNATLTIQKNGTDVQTFTANASSNVTANITVPTDTSDLTNGAGYITGITSGDITTALGYTPQEELVSGTNIKTINGQSILGSGNLDTPYRNIGEIVASTIPLIDAGLHLLDGSLLVYGSYQAFIDYIADLYDSGNYTDIFETEANWQSAVTTYGVCGKFVYDSVANTVRLPKITGILEGTTDVTALGDLIDAGLPNITGLSCWAAHNSYSPSGAFYTSNTTKTNLSSSLAESGKAEGFDASRSSSIYGNSTTVQPQTIKVLYYIVIATTTKTDIEVDIDDIVTDLNGKADVDLTNTTPAQSFINSSMVWGLPDYDSLISISVSVAYTAPSIGWIWGYSTVQANASINVNGHDVWYGNRFNQTGNLHRSGQCFVDKGDVVTFSNMTGAQFCPLKGVS